MSDKKITYSVGFKADKSGLENIRKSLQEISKLGVTQFKLETGKSKEELDKIKTAAENVQDALTSAFNVNLNTLDLTKFSQEIKSTQGSFSNLAKTMNGAGRTGQAAFSDLLGTILTTKDAVHGTNKLLDSMAKTFLNTVKWSISSSILNAFTGSIQKAWGYTKQLDESLNNIRIVTEKSNEEMERFAKNANKAAKSLGATTTSYTNAALIYYQQGLGEADVQARTQTTIKAANVTGQSAAEVSEQLTAVWNGYKVVAEEAELYVDKLAAVAATTAADLEELSNGMSKVASAANAMGVDIDQLSAQLATIVSVTRQDANIVGTALKTIYSRMADLKVDGTDEFGVSLGEVSSSLKEVGIEILDSGGNLREMGTVIEEVASKWDTWTVAQQQAIAQSIAGKRQFNNLLALFENWDMYEGALTTSQTSEGTLQKQQDIYMDSIEARLTKLRAASEGLFDNLIDSESTKSLIDVLTWVVEALDNLAQGLGGLGNILQMTGGILTRVFSSQITQGIGQIYTNRQNSNFNNAQAASAAELGLSPEKGAFTEGQQKAIDIGAERIRLSRLLTEEEKEHYNVLIKQTLDQEKQKKLLEEKINLKKKEVAALTGADTTEMSAEELANRYRTQADLSRGVAMTAANASEAKTLKDRRKALNKIGSASLTAENSGALAGLNEKYKDTLNAIKNGTFDAAKQQESFNNYLKEAEALLSKNADELEENARQSEKLAQETKELNAAEKAREEDLKRMSKAAHFKEITQQVTNLVSSLTMAASAMSILSNAFKILEDDSLSTEEQIGQFITAILSGLGMLIPIIMSSVKAIGTKVTAEMTKVQAQAVKTQAAFGWISLAIMAIVAITAASVALTKAIMEDSPTAAEKAKTAYEETKKSVEETQNALKAARNEYSALMEAMNNYQTGRNALDKLAEGTDAWKAKIIELNQQVTDLLIKYPQLAQYVTTNDDGVMEVAKEGWDKLKEEQEKKIRDTTRANSLAQLSNSIAKNDVNRANLTETIRTGDTLDVQNMVTEQEASTAIGVGSAVGGVGGAVAAGAIAGSVVPGIGTAIGAAIGAAVGAVAGVAIAAIGVATTNAIREGLNEEAEAAVKEIEEAIPKIGVTNDGKKAEEEIEQLAAATTIDQIKAIEGLEDITDLAAEAMLENKEAIIQNIQATDENTRAINAMKKTYLQELATSLGINDATTFANISADIVDAEKMKTSDHLNKYIIAGKGKTLEGEYIGNKINTSNDRKYAKDAVNNWIKHAYGIEGTVTENDLDGLTYQTFEDKKFTLSDGTVVTGRQIREAAAAKDVEEAVKAETEKQQKQMLALQNNGLDSHLAYFLEGNSYEDWMTAGGTLSALNSVSEAANSTNASNLGYTIDKTAIANAVAAERTAISNFISEQGLDFSVDTLSNMSAQDRKNFEYTLASAQGGGRKQDLLGVLNQYADDPENFAKVAREAAGVDFSNKFAAADFFFKHTEEIQTKLRKQELDYFKTINAELEKNHKLMERAVGLERQNLLNRQVALEKESQLQAQQNATEARQILDTYLAAHGETNTFLNADGTVNVKAVNDKIATLDEEIDAQEIEYLNNILAYWDKVVETESAAQETINKVIDAQIAAYEYQYEAMAHLLEISKKFRDVYYDINHVTKGGFKGFEEESVSERLRRASQNFQGSYTGLSTSINKINGVDVLLNNFNKDILGVDGNSKVGYDKTNIDDNDTKRAVNSITHYLNAGSYVSKESTIQRVFGEYGANFYDATSNTFNTAKFSESLEQDFETAFNFMSDLSNQLKEMYDIWLDAQDQLMKLYDQEIQKLTSVNSILKSSADLWQLVGDGSEAVNNIYAQMVNNATTSATYAKMQLAVAQEEFTKVKNLGADASEEMQNTVRENLQKATEAVISTTQAQLDALAQQFSTKLKTILDSAVGGSLAGVTEDWELATANDERYLDTVNETYAIDSLNRSFFRSIDETNNIAAKNKLLTKQVEIEEKLESIKKAQDKLTQADLDRANAEYELTLKQIALEEAQQAANKMKLTRDANGNYTYQYVADENNIAKAEEELAAAENKLYNMEKDRTKSLVSEYYSTMSEANTKISEAVAAGDKERVMKLKEYYGGLLGGIQAELNTSSAAFERLGGNIENWQVPFEDFTDAIENTKLATLFGEEGSITTAIDGLFGEEGSITTLQASLKQMLGSEGALGIATTALSNTVKDTGELAIETGKLVAAADEVVKNLPDLTETVNTLVENLKGYTTQYQTWLEQQTNLSTSQEKAIIDQTKAIKEQTIATLNLIDAMDGEIDGQDSLGRNIAANGYSYSDGGWIANDLDISGNETK